MNARASGIREQQSLRERLREEEEFGSMAVRRMQKAEDQLRHVEDNAKQALPTMHEELNELRRALRLQEDMHARTRSELEAPRLVPESIFQQASSIPISSRTTKSGWECVSRDRVQAFPVGTEVRSPEILTPSHRSPANREKFDFAQATQGVPLSVVEDAAPVRFIAARRRASTLAFCAACIVFFLSEKNPSEPSDARAVRSRQLNELLSTLGMTGRASSSSFSGSKGVRYDADLASDIAVANLVVEDAKVIAAPKNQDSSIHDARLKQLEDEYLERIAEMRSEMEKAQKAEQRLRADRDEWRLMAENLQATGGKMQLKKVKTMTMETINQLMTHTAVILLPKSTVMTTVEVRHARLVRVQIVTILMEAMIRRSRKLRFLAVKLTKLWYLLSQW
eukprot:s3495_g3.t1